MSIYRLALIINNPANNDEFLLLKQSPPPKFGIEEYDSYVDSELFDLPSTQLSLIQDQSQFELDDAELCSHKLDLRNFDFVSALNQVSEELGIGRLVELRWKFCKYVQDPEFGPDPPVHTVFISTNFALGHGYNEGTFLWLSWPKCIELLRDVKQGCSRIGLLAVNSILHDSELSKWDVPQNLRYQEYPLGVMLVPMGSRTTKPFSTTNLIVVAPDIVANSQNNASFAVNGDALIVDPGCSSRFHQELEHIVAALPKKLIVFVTHHHTDHVDETNLIAEISDSNVCSVHICSLDAGEKSDKRGSLGEDASNMNRKTRGTSHIDTNFVTSGVFDSVNYVSCVNFVHSRSRWLQRFSCKLNSLAVIQRCNPDAILLAHDNTMCRVRKDVWSLGYTSIVGGEEISVGGQQFQVIFAPGHTDGHMALLHINSHSLVVGDHCVGQGSALLDIYSGGNMADYFQTTYNFLELSPRALIPMHGRVNLWPSHMLSQYLKNRKDRESSVLKVIENGGTTLFDIVSTIYKDVDRSLWIPAASNVRLHVEHLAQQQKLPEDFSLEAYKRSIGTFADEMSKL